MAESSPLTVALDAMGSDNAPRVEIAGALEAAARLPELQVCLVGRPELLGSPDTDYSERITIVPASETVGMHESPAEIVKRKRDSSIAVGIDMVKSGRAAAFVSAGNTGAVMAFAITTLGVIPGVHRPTLGVMFPNRTGSTLVLDVGANVETKPFQLQQFALMGATAAAHLLRKANPSVAILNIGREAGKGNELAVRTAELLQQTDLNFIGNIEGHDLLEGAADVAVCDGFVGNILLKYTEGMGELLARYLDEYLHSETNYRMRRWLSKPVLHEFIDRLDWQQRGGALLLGVNGTVVVAHGRSTPRAIKNALYTAMNAAGDHLTDRIRERFSRLEN